MQFEWSDGCSGFLEIDDHSLEYQCIGPPPGDDLTIVLLHEGLGSVALWKDFPEALSARTGLGVLVYSRQGYGRSSPAQLPRPMDYMTREAIDVLPGVLDAAGLEHVVLAGHSDGATISAIYAGSVEDFRIRGLVLMAPHFFTEPEGLASIAEARNSYEAGDLRLKLEKYHKDVDNAFYGWNSAWLDPQFRDWNVSDVIDYLRVPVLAIQGESDAYGTLAQIREVESRSYAPVDVVVLEGCGHSPHRDQPDATLTAISDFTSRLTRIESEQVQII